MSVLAEARKFLADNAAAAASSSSPTPAAAAAAADEPVQFIISIVDDNLHGAYEQELYAQRVSSATRFTGSLSLERLLADDADESPSARPTPSYARATAKSSASRASLSRTVAAASVSRAGAAFGATPSRAPRVAASVSSAATPRRASAIGVTPAARRTAPSSERRATLSPRGSASRSAAAASPQWQLRETYESAGELKRDFDAVLPDLSSERSAAWEKQTAALDALEHMLAATPSDAVLLAVLGTPLLVRALAELLKSPRSALVRRVAQLATKLTERLVADVRWRRREAPDVLAALQQTLASRTNIISECAHDSLLALAPTLPTSVLLPAIRSMCGQPRDARLRCTGAELLAILLQRNDGADIDDADLAPVQALVLALLTDADAEARRNGRICFAAFCNAFPTLAAALEDSLDPEARRAVARAGGPTPSKSPAPVVTGSPPSRLRAPSGGRAATTPRRTSLPHPGSTPAATASRLKQPAVFASTGAAAAATAVPLARKANIRKPVTRKLFLGDEPLEDDGATAVAVAATPPTRSRSNSLEWFDSLTSSPAVKKPEGLLIEDAPVSAGVEITPDDEALLRAAASQLLAEQQLESADASVPNEW